ncbi:MAG: glucosamine-6-phosphate deaminase [Planctomycetes bacterium]|nr:glucosamine-6-phosphate deaminase [Planctomycetota bacterium]
MNEGQQRVEPDEPCAAGAPQGRHEPIQVTVHPTAEDACAAVAGEVLELVAARPTTALGLATGSTMVGVYRALVGALEERGLRMDEARTFNLDEYLGLPPGSEESFRAFMDRHLFTPARVSSAQVSFPASPDAQPGVESVRSARAFEAAIEAAGGLDLQLLGLGGNGHIAFNEPGSRADSRTREVELAPRTREDAARTFGGLDEVPRRAVTMGVGTILEARRIRIVALGEHKAEIVARLVRGEDGARLPACHLVGHPDVQLHVDAAAASRLAAG